jgi:hypothetical protein
MGFGSAEVREERSVARHAALATAMATFVEAWARKFPRLAPRAFSAKLAAARTEVARDMAIASSPRRRGSARIARALAEVVATATSAA